jgi:hypothetical protein
VLEFRDIDTPGSTDNEVLVRVHAAGLHRGDWHVMTGLPYLIRLVVPELGLRRRTIRAPELVKVVRGISRTGEFILPWRHLSPHLVQRSGG